MFYARNSLSDPDDDMGSVIEGEKEIYYLKSIETKTHKAIFITSDRADAYSASKNSNVIESTTAKGDEILQKLDRIDLYAKKSDGSLSDDPIKTVHFDYTYELGRGLPNSASGNEGKLTLKKVWFEYEGVVNARIAPYTFEYQYKTKDQYEDFLPPAIAEKYDTIISFAENLADTLDQNPVYNPLNIDPWGNYQKGGDLRYAEMKPWVNQDPELDFDPAAWQLKQIHLPSGGEIHVQYEQDDYRYVQDQPAMAMLSLKDDPTSESDNKFFINEGDLGINISEFEGELDNHPELIDLQRKIIDQFLLRDQRLYFKFLYKLIGNGQPQLDFCNAEFIDGYVKVKKVDIDEDDGLYVELGSVSGGKHELPKQVCREFVKSQRAGKLNANGNCDASANGVQDNSDGQQVVMSFIPFVKSFAYPPSLCKEINPEYSYLRVPICQAKKGGGVRVKRLLMFDKGIETGAAMLYGSEYQYQTLNKEGKAVSSGVAANEPPSIREENALVRYIPKKHQSLGSKLIAGKDKEQLEGPYGESVFPGASVGYSKVVVKNIHSGKTNTGITVNDFHTARQHPVIVKNTTIDNKSPIPINIPTGVINYSKTDIYLSQGYSIQLNNMHGQPKRIATYGGDVGNPLVPDSTFLSTEQSFEYFDTKNGEKVPMLYDVTQGVVYENPGKESEVVFESREVEDISTDGTIEGDISLGLPFFPFISGVPELNRNADRIRTHVTTKVISYPAIQKCVTTYQDGIYHQTNNMAFNPETGKPVITETTDGFHLENLLASADHNGMYTNFDFPASHQYSAMGQRAENETVVLDNLDATYDDSGSEPIITLNQNNGCCLDIETGDLIRVSSSSSEGFFNISGIGAAGINLKASSHFTGNLSGPVSVDTIEVLKSGKQNTLSQSAGNITTYGDEMFESFSGMVNVQGIQDMTDAANDIITDMFTNNILIASLNTTKYNFSMTSSCGCRDITKIEFERTPSLHQFQFACIADEVNTTDDEFVARFFDQNSVIICEIPLKPTFPDKLLTRVDFFSGAITFIPELIYSQFSGNGRLSLSGWAGQENSVCASLFSLMDCHFCSNEIVTASNVIAAAAQTFEDNWQLTSAVANPYGIGFGGDNPFITGARGKWRQKENYVYESTIIGGAKPGETVYDEAGVFDEFTFFNWQNPSANDPEKWIKLNTVKTYDPNGNALEEENILGIQSTAKFGYSKTLPTVVAQNSDYRSVQFESFENLYGGNTLEENRVPGNNTVVNSTAHSGQQSLMFSEGGSFEMNVIQFIQQLDDHGIFFSIWVKDLSYDNAPVLVEVTSVGGGIIKTVPMESVAEVGEWRLFKGNLLNTGFFVVEDLTIKITENSASGTVYIDDVRIQPFDAQAICYVYDVDTRRLITSFDDQHFGLYYQYNAEGKLIRKQIETERGIKTIQETQYHTPQVSR